LTSGHGASNCDLDTFDSLSPCLSSSSEIVNFLLVALWELLPDDEGDVVFDWFSALEVADDLMDDLDVRGNLVVVKQKSEIVDKGFSLFSGQFRD
jgi:hypothetical protein